MSKLPRHVLLVMDGNGRWATARGKSRMVGHRAGFKAIPRIVDAAEQLGIEVLTLWAFSTENWNRAPEEVDGLMSLAGEGFVTYAENLRERTIRVRVIGDRLRLSETLQKQIAHVESETAAHTGMNLVILFSYGGRWDLAQAMRRLGARIERGELRAEQIDEALIAETVSLSDLPLPDLLIRTGGEMRLSNSMMWQLAYTELYFTETYWPDFDEAAFRTALQAYASRERRFGRVLLGGV